MSCGIWQSIEFVVNREGEELLVTPPSFRSDVFGEVEVIEEIARLHGYEKFSSELRPQRPGNVPDAPLHVLARRIRERLIAFGLLETRPMPFVRTGDDAHRVRNPLAEDEAYLRTTLLDTLSRRVEHNFAHMQRNIRLFEIGTVFTAARDEQTGAPAERTHAAVVIVGERRPSHFTDSHPPVYDEWDAKGIAEVLASAAWPETSVTLDPSVGDVLWNVAVNGTAVGTVQRLTVDAPVWAAPVYGIEMDLSAIPDSGRSTASRYVPIPDDAGDRGRPRAHRSRFGNVRSGSKRHSRSRRRPSRVSRGVRRIPRAGPGRRDAKPGVEIDLQAS